MNGTIIDSGRLPPDAIMAKDADLLAELDPNGPTLLHFYDWEGPCLTYGYFIRPDRHLDFSALHHHGIKAARRPTGGGIIFHLADLSFSVLLPANHPHISLNPLENYAYINQKVAQAIAHLTSNAPPQLLQKEPLCRGKECLPFCMAKPTQFDLIAGGKKVGGAAQRRTKKGLLHQTSLTLLPPNLKILHSVLLHGDSIIEAMGQNSSAILFGKASEEELPFYREQLKSILGSIILDKFKVQL